MAKIADTPAVHWLDLLGRNSAYRAFWGSRTISFLGDAIATIALVLDASRQADAGIAVGLLLLAQALPRLLGPFAGAVADRTDQRRLMVVCDLGQAILFGVVALILPPFPIVLVLVAAATVLATFFLPAGRGALPVLVAPAGLTAANALLTSGLNLGYALGPAAGGLIATTLGVRGALVVDALTFVASAALLARLPALPSAQAAQDVPSRSVLRETRAGLAYLARHPTARAVTLGLFLSVAFAALDNVALVFLAARDLHGGAAGYGLLATVNGAGMILGPLILLRRAQRASASVLLAGLAVMGTGLLLTGGAPLIGLAAVGLGLTGVGNGLQNTANTTLIQTTVPRPLLGRVVGTAYSGAFLASGLAYAAGGPLLAHTSPRVVFGIAGAGVLAALAVVWTILPRQADEAMPPE